MMLAAVLTEGISDTDAQASIMYMQSYVVPALFEVCKSGLPDRANEFEKAMTAWSEKHRVIVATGESIVRKRAKQENTDVDSAFAARREAMVSELKALDPQKKVERCDSLLKLTRAEI